MCSESKTKYVRKVKTICNIYQTPRFSLSNKKPTKLPLNMRIMRGPKPNKLSSSPIYDNHVGTTNQTNYQAPPQ